MLGNRREAVATPSSTRCHMDGRSTGIHQRSRCRPQRGPRGDHVIHEQDATLRRAGAAHETRTGQPRFPAGA